MKHRLFLTTRRLGNELESLQAPDRGELMAKWRNLYGTEPPVGVRNNFLMHAIAHRMQEMALGKLKPVTRHFLEKAAKDNASRQQILPVISNIKPGTRLLREWHGTTYEVIVMEDCVYCDGRRYRSLTELASAITGTHWSGPMFFGLKKREVS
ncbi:MAG: DUF2924 domain-containing protein [Syntrophales bacterium]|jgi:hypothetical protein